MSYRVIVFFMGPKSVFSEKPHPHEMVLDITTPFLWSARRVARANRGNTGRLSHVIMRGEECIEHVPATTPYVAGL